MPPTWRTCCWPNAAAGNSPRRPCPRPKRRELIDDIELEPADPAFYDRFCHDTEEDSHGTT